MSLLGKLMDTMRLSSEDDEDDYYLDDDFEDEAPGPSGQSACGLVFLRFRSSRKSIPPERSFPYMQF